MATLDVGDLEGKVQQMYRQVAEQPQTPPPITSKWAERLPSGLAIPRSYSPLFLRVRWSHSPAWAISFDLASLQHRETVIDLGSGSGVETLDRGRPGGTIRPGRGR